MSRDNCEVAIFQWNHPQVMTASTTSIPLIDNEIIVTTEMGKMLRGRKSWAGVSLDKQGQLCIKPWSRTHRPSSPSSSSELSILKTNSFWGKISWWFETCLNLQSMRKESRENSKKIKPQAQRNSLILGSHKMYHPTLDTSEYKCGSVDYHSEMDDSWQTGMYVIPALRVEKANGRGGWE